MSQYLLLLYDNSPSLRALSPEEMQKATEKYMAWSKMPFTQAGKRLGMDAGKILRPHNGKPKVTDGPYGETKEALGGFYLIEAENYDKAVELAMTNPHVEYGGVIEVRHIFGT